MTNLLSRLCQPTILIAVLVILWQLITLGRGHLNGDEALSILLIEQLHHLKTGNWAALTLNPIVSYVGPHDVWVMGSLYALTGLFSSEASAALVRLPALIAVWLGMWILSRELRQRSPSLAQAFLFWVAASSMIFVYSRTAFQYGLLIGYCAILTSESLRISRTGKVRWLLIGIFAGLGLQLHTSAIPALAFMFWPVLPSLRKSVVSADAKGKLYLILGVAAFCILSYPVVRNFPPPIMTGTKTNRPLHDELFSLLKILTGTRTYQFLHRTVPPIVIAAFVSAYLWNLRKLWFQIKRLRTSHHPSDQEMRRYAFAAWFGVGALLVVCWQGRSLNVSGHERYLLAMWPMLLVVTADRWQSALQSTRTTFILAILLIGPHVATFARYLSQPIPLADSVIWLEKNCPRETCVVVAENYWSYWPFRYYSRDRLDIDYLSDVWTPVRRPVLHGRKTVTCLMYRDEPARLKLEARYASTSLSAAYFSPGQSSAGQACFSSNSPLSVP